MCVCVCVCVCVERERERESLYYDSYTSETAKYIRQIHYNTCTSTKKIYRRPNRNHRPSK